MPEPVRAPEHVPNLPAVDTQTPSERRRARTPPKASAPKPSPTTQLAPREPLLEEPHALDVEV